MKQFKQSLLIAVFNIIFISSIYGNTFGQGCDTLPVNARLSCKAWVLYDTANAHEDPAKYQEAIDTANVCIAFFSIDAIDKECHFRDIQEPPPQKGTVSDSVKKKIHENGLENDVGTCWFIKGLCFKALFLADTSNISIGCSSWVAFKTTQFYTYARTWDPRGWFWSPAEGAEQEISSLTNLDTTICGTISIECPIVLQRFRKIDARKCIALSRKSSSITYISLQGRVLGPNIRSFRKAKLPMILPKQGEIANKAIWIY
ncbi:MAG: hypothetical protein JXB48_24160 [Candidatus Latescibacteria bacterium]|nr:hypothetical protein [Candidatus Latescibacterota bacterium]